MDNSTIKTLLDYCDSDAPERQAEALVGLLNAKVYEAVPKIIKLLNSPDAAIRYSAADALGYLGIYELETVGKVLTALLNDPEDIVRSVTVEALGSLGYIPALERIKLMLKNDPSALVRASAAESLGYFGTSEALETLENSLLNYEEDESVRCYAANSMGLLGTAELLPKLDTYLKSEPSEEVRAELLAARYWLGAKNLLENGEETLAIHILNILKDLRDRTTDLSLLKAPRELDKVLKKIP